MSDEQLALALAPTAELAELEAAALPHLADVDARVLYLATLSEDTRATTAATIRKLAELILPGFVGLHGVERVPWHMLRYPHVVAVRSALTSAVDAHRIKRRTANRYLSTLRAVLRHAWLAEQVPEDAYRKAIEGTAAIDGEDLPAGRTITSGEVRALTCAPTEPSPAPAMPRCWRSCSVPACAGPRPPGSSSATSTASPASSGLSARNAASAPRICGVGPSRR